MYNYMGTSRRGRLLKEMDEKQHDICTRSIQDSRKNMEQRQIKYSVGTRTKNHYFHSQAHNIDLRTNNKVIIHTYFWSFGIHSAAPTLLDVL
jgi:hypothetical protein